MKRTLHNLLIISLLVFSFLRVQAQDEKISFYTESSPRLRGMMVRTDVDEAGLRTLASWGANHVRWQLTWDGFPHSRADNEDSTAYHKWLEASLAHVDQMLPLCKELGLKVLIDLHTLPGGKTPDYNNRMFREKAWQDVFMNVWREIATRYKDNPTVWGYDLANEPQDGVVKDGAVDWPTLASMAAHEVRAIDPLHPIIVEARGGDWSTLIKFQPIDVPGLVYSFHMYTPMMFTHQSISKDKRRVHYPGRIGLKYWDKNDLEDIIDKVRDWQLANNAQIYVGEFSAIRWAPDDDAHTYLADLIDLFERNNWSWCYHAFREYQGWSVEVGNDRSDESPSATPTSRQLLFMDAFKKNGK